jgi:hypothetical protein
MKLQRNTLLKAFLAVLAVAAVAVPTAFGSDLRSPDTQDAAKAPLPTSIADMISPDTQDAAKAGRTGSVPDMVSPDTEDAAKGRPFGSPTIEVVTVAGAPSFDWIDAGIGAASGLGAALIAAGVLLLALKRQRRSVAVA